MLTLLVAAWGCEREGLVASNDGDPWGALDAGSLPRPRDAAIERPEVGVVDLGPLPEPACACRSLPATCTPPALGVPAFSPPGEDLQAQLLGLIACADESLRVAIYQAGWDCLSGAIATRLDAAPTLEVQIVLDDQECPLVGGARACALGGLASHPRVTILDDARSRYMHHKFVVVDDEWVWQSSANWSRNSFCTDANNALVLDQEEIVSGYLSEFDRLFVDRVFGPTPPRVFEGGTTTLYFSPETPIADPSRWFVELVSAIEDAQGSVEFMTSAWTRTEVSDAMIAAHRRGVRVKGLVDRAYASAAPAQALWAEGIELRAGNVHSKFLVVDGSLVVTGSPNWSQNAWQNNEASLFLRDSTLAGLYRAEVERLFDLTPAR